MEWVGGIGREELERFRGWEVEGGVRGWVGGGSGVDGVV